MLSNSDSSCRNPEDTFFDDLYKDYRIRRVYASRSVSAKADKRGKLAELLVCNYADNGFSTISHDKSLKFSLNINDYGQGAYKRTV